MAVVFSPNQQLTKNDLNIFVRDESNTMFDPYFIKYTVEDEEGNSIPNLEVLTPEKESVGWYWANFIVPTESSVGTYIIKWFIQDTSTSNLQQLEQKFGIVKKQDCVSFTPTIGGVVYYPGQALSEKDLYIIIRNNLGNQSDPFQISYEVFQRIQGLDVLISPIDQAPLRLGVGHYFANYMIPGDALPGDYYIKWKFKETPSSEESNAIQEFAVVDGSVVIESPFGSTEKALIRKLRFVLRDNNPDRNYHFMPPAQEEVIQGFTQKFGYVWEDEELFEYICFAISDLNNHPPREAWAIETLPDRLFSIVLSQASAVALRALAINWAHEEWQGDISGVGLTIEKSSKYLAIKENFEAAYERQLTEHKEYGVRYVTGIRQSRYNVGVTSALGPFSNIGVQNRRNYVG
ncbi:hypothetical protein N9948_01480 [bacterium]|nr:hypothetical protein [bacterium]